MNEPKDAHWLLIELQYEHKTINIYDSWGPNQALLIAGDTPDVLDTPYVTPLAVRFFLPAV